MKLKLIVIVIVVAICSLIVGFLLHPIITNNKKVENIDNKNTTTSNIKENNIGRNTNSENTITSTSKTNSIDQNIDDEIDQDTDEVSGIFSLYKMDITNANTNEVITKKLNDNFTIEVKVVREKLGAINWYISVNNKKDVCTDGVPYDINELKFHYTNNYIFYKAHLGTGNRTEKLVVIGKNGNVVKEIYELDKKDKGMVPCGFEYGYDFIKINGTRWDGVGYDICTKKYNDPSFEVALEKNYKDIVIDADYIYRADDKGNFNFDNPEVIEKETLKMYVKNNKEYLLKSYKNNEKKIELVTSFLEKNEDEQR